MTPPHPHRPELGLALALTTAAAAAFGTVAYTLYGSLLVALASAAAVIAEGLILCVILWFFPRKPRPRVPFPPPGPGDPTPFTTGHRFRDVPPEDPWTPAGWDLPYRSRDPGDQDT